MERGRVDGIRIESSAHESDVVSLLQRDSVVRLEEFVAVSDSAREAGDSTSSLRASSAAVERFPDRREGYIRMAQDLLSLKRFEEAQEVIHRGLQRFPSQAQLVSLAMIVSRKFGDMEGLLHYSMSLVASHPVRREGYGRTIQALIALRRMDKAEQMIASSLDQFPDWVRLLVLASDAARLRGQRADSLAYARRVIDLDADRPEGYCRAIQDLIFLGELDAAQDLGQRALKSLPDDSHVLYALLDLARVRSDLRSAQSLLSLVDAADPSDWALMRGAQQVAPMETPEHAAETLRRGYAALLAHRHASSDATLAHPSRIALGEARGPSPLRPITLLTRFSIFDPDFGGFRVLKDSRSPEDYMRFLFSPDRMDFKFKVFEKVTLPSVMAQQDQDFTWVVLAGEQLSIGHRQRLMTLAEANEQLVVHFVPSMAPLFMMEFSDDDVTVRLDDDDAIRSDFITRVRNSPQRPGTLLSFPWGRKYEWTGSEMRIAAQPFYVPNNAQGLAAFGMNVFGCGRHSTVHDAFEVVYDYEPDMFNVCCSEYCDTNRWFPQTSPAAADLQ